MTSSKVNDCKIEQTSLVQFPKLQNVTFYGSSTCGRDQIQTELGAAAPLGCVWTLNFGNTDQKLEGNFFVVIYRCCQRRRVYQISNDTVVNWQLAAFHIQCPQQVKLGNSQNQARTRGVKPLTSTEGSVDTGTACSVQSFDELPVTVTVVGRNNSNGFLKVFFFF